MKENAYLWEYKVGINVIIANFVCLWKCQMNRDKIQKWDRYQGYPMSNNTYSLMWSGKERHLSLGR